MTHDELLAKMKELSRTFAYEPNLNFESALRAVVELHKVILHKNYDTDIDRYECQVCKDTLYPCETIQAIEKELQ
jgi:hypothetical protein